MPAKENITPEAAAASDEQRHGREFLPESIPPRVPKLVEQPRKVEKRKPEAQKADTLSPKRKRGRPPGTFKKPEPSPAPPRALRAGGESPLEELALLKEGSGVSVVGLEDG